MALEYEAPGYEQYLMDYAHPHRELEPKEREIAIVNEALLVLQAEGIISHANYPQDLFLAHRAAVAEHFEIPWTAITPRMQRVLYAINAIHQPARTVAAGVFCGNTFFSNAGAAAGPGACYIAEDLVGVEIKPEEAERAERNVRKLDPSGVARVVAADAVDVVRDYNEQIDLLYLDADGGPERGKGVYLDILQEALAKLSPGAIVLAHNSINCAERLKYYLDFVRDEANFSRSVNLKIDGEGLEVSCR